MDTVAVSLSDVTKVYKTYNHPRDRLLEMLFRGKRQYHRSFYALKNVTFDIPRGTTFGILGRNGSGKSTLLQIIASVLQPTAGKAAVRGRVSALLELGSGFNPDFTGIDNVYLYASILGLSREEIDARLPAILAFAEIGDFVYQPLKTYSSGMVVRLAFAVAVSIDPDIFLVDEALAVGDALFQHKCMLRMREIMKSGATVIFVSHDLGSVTTLCERAVLLERGEVVANGDAETVAREYHRRLFEGELADDKPSMGSDFGKSSAEGSARKIHEQAQLPPAAPSEAQLQEFALRVQALRFGTGEARIAYVEILDKDLTPTSVVAYNERFTIRLHIDVLQPISSVIAGFNIRNSRGLDILVSNNHIEHRPIRNAAPGERLVVDFALNNIMRDDHYSVSAGVTHEDFFHQAKPFDWVDNSVILRTSQPADTIIYGSFYPRDVAVSVWQERSEATRALAVGGRS